VLADAMHTIETPRLKLLRMTLEFFDLCLSGDREAASRYASANVAEQWMEDLAYINMRRDQLVADPSYAPWCVRMIVLKDTGQMIGQIGFHTPPDPPGLRAMAPGSIEFGYRVYNPHRRQGYATEAAKGLMQWATSEYNIQSYVVSISPHNLASQNMARLLGFTKIGEQIDEVDGLEDVLVLEGEALERAASQTKRKRQCP
jgi:RimJ/RimL family protein N-acetyltransferase